METYSMINFFGKKKETSGSVSEGMLDPHNIPRHVAIIMDAAGPSAKACPAVTATAPAPIR